MQWVHVERGEMRGDREERGKKREEGKCRDEESPLSSRSLTSERNSALILVVNTLHSPAQPSSPSKSVFMRREGGPGLGRRLGFLQVQFLAVTVTKKVFM